MGGWYFVSFRCWRIIIFDSDDLILDSFFNITRTLYKDKVTRERQKFDWVTLISLTGYQYH